MYLLAEAWIDAAVEQGLERDMATHLVRETIAGSAALWQATRSQPAALREAVTSPGGTTAAALAALGDFDFPAAMRAPSTPQPEGPRNWPRQDAARLC